MKEIITLHDFHAVCEYLNQDLLDDYLGAFYDARWYPSDEMMRRHSEAAAKLWEDFDKDDPVFFDMDKDGYSDNVGILSDKTTRKGVLKVIYNYIDPGYTIEKDILENSRITGHFRWAEL